MTLTRITWVAALLSLFAALTSIGLSIYVMHHCKRKLELMYELYATVLRSVNKLEGLQKETEGS